MRADEMNAIPGIDMTATGNNIMRLKIKGGMTMKDLQYIFEFSMPPCDTFLFS